MAPRRLAPVPTHPPRPGPTLVRQVLQTGLEVEMGDHVGYEPHAIEGRGSGNSRNGTYPKMVTTEIGKVDLRVPRDRNGTFDPVTVRKGERRLAGLAGNVISLYAKGMTTGFVEELVARVRRAGAVGALTLRADSGFFSWELIKTLNRVGIAWSIMVGMNPSVRRAIAGVSDRPCKCVT